MRLLGLEVSVLVCSKSSHEIKFYPWTKKLLFYNTVFWHGYSKHVNHYGMSLFLQKGNSVNETVYQLHYLTGISAHDHCRATGIAVGLF